MTVRIRTGIACIALIFSGVGVRASTAAVTLEKLTIGWRRHRGVTGPFWITKEKVRSAKPEDFVDMNIIREFDANGFIDRLYKKR